MKKGKKKDGLKITRRQFLKSTLATGAIVAAGGAGVLIKPDKAHALVVSDGFKKFATAYRLLPPLAASDGTKTWGDIVATHYTIDIKQFDDYLADVGARPAGYARTRLWGFNPANNATPRHLGGIIVSKKGTPVQITFRNNLTTANSVTQHIIPNDTTIPGANQAFNRTAIHLHGGLVPWISDGGPFDWWAPDGTHGLSFLNNQILRPGQTVPLDEAEYYYPNNQSARLVWYHDHAWGITRINAYAGIASAFVIRDDFEASLVGSSPGQGLPDYIENGGREIPIVIQDKTFIPQNFVDPTWPVTGSQPGDLWYAHTYDPKLYKLAGNKKGNKAVPPVSVVPEFFGDTMLANGMVYPETTVEARRYRLRLLNACGARFLNLQLFVEDNNGDSITLNPLTLVPTNQKGPDFLMIGSEGGFLANPVGIPSNTPFNPLTLTGSLILAPAERADIIINFSGFAGQKIVLYNDAPAPFPVGNPLFDYFLGNPLNPVQPAAGFGPNTRQIMRFNVVTASGSDPALNISPATDLTPGLDPFIIPIANVRNGTWRNVLPAGTTTRYLTLNETFDIYGRLEQRLGTALPIKNVGGGFGRAYIDPPTEIASAGSTEVWEIYNLTADSHPIHFHLVNVQILERQAFRVTNFNGIPASLIGLPRPPDPDEQGWKETVRMHPGEVTRVIMRFDLPAVPFNILTSPRAGAGDANNPGLNIGALVPAGQAAHEYVWHCHILEHEEHDMMRPLVVIGQAPPSVVPTTKQVSTGTGGTVTFTIVNGYKPFTVIQESTTGKSYTPTLNAAGDAFNVTVSAGDPAATVVFRITDFAGEVVRATLKIV